MKNQGKTQELMEVGLEGAKFRIKPLIVLLVIILFVLDCVVTFTTFGPFPKLNFR